MKLVSVAFASLLLASSLLGATATASAANDSLPTSVKASVSDVSVPTSSTSVVNVDHQVISSVQVTDSIPSAVQATVTDAAVQTDPKLVSSPVHQLLSTTSPTGIKDGLVTPFGASPPTGSGSLNLANNDYNYSVDSLGYRVYTDVIFTGASNIQVSVLNFKKFSGSSPSRNIGVSLYTSGGTYVAAVDINMTDYPNGAYVTFTGTSASTRYYVMFSSATNGNLYSFNGKINSF